MLSTESARHAQPLRGRRGQYCGAACVPAAGMAVVATAMAANEAMRGGASGQATGTRCQGAGVRLAEETSTAGLGLCMWCQERCASGAGRGWVPGEAPS